MVELKLVTGRDGKTYTPKRRPKPPPGPAERLAKPPPPSDAEMFEDEMGELDRAIKVLFWLVSRATDAERAELAALWADELADYGKRLRVIEAGMRVTPA